MISSIFTLFGIVIALAAFIYLLNAVDKGKRLVSGDYPFQKQSSQTKSQNPNHPVPKQVIRHKPALKELSDELKNLIPHRECPLCGSILKKDDPLYACFIEPNGTKKILIYGCPYCYKDEPIDKKGKQK